MCYHNSAVTCITTPQDCEILIYQGRQYIAQWQMFTQPIYVTGFGKTCIVHTSDFGHLEMHKNQREWWTGLKFLGMIQE